MLFNGLMVKKEKGHPGNENLSVNFKIFLKKKQKSQVYKRLLLVDNNVINKPHRSKMDSNASNGTSSLRIIGNWLKGFRI